MNIMISHVSKSFDKKPIIKDVTLTVSSGEIVCLLGPSGAGKTTLIRLLIGAITADDGFIQFDDTLMPNLKLMKHIGFMPQNDALYDDLSGEDNLRFFAGLFGLKKNIMAQRIDDVLALVDLSGDRRKYVKKYSGGMKKRLSLAVSLLHEPDVMLLDEPTVGIDPLLRQSIWNHFKQMKAAGKTIIVSTHVMDEVSECDKAALIYNGQLIHFDLVQSLLSKTQNGKVEELFLMAAKKREEGDNA